MEFVQSQLNTVSSLPPEQLCSLLCSVAHYKDAAAVVYVYDVLKSNKVDMTAEMWAAMKRVESRE
jgi:ribosome-associated toxin RatA of RatAB toxin-antitoxin module